MSVLADKLRSVVFSNLRGDVPKSIRQAAWDLFSAIDSDLDVAGYIPSSTTDEIIEKFDETLRRGIEGDDDFDPYEDIDYGDDDDDVDPVNLFDNIEDDTTS